MSLYSTTCYLLLALFSFNQLNHAQVHESLYREGVNELSQGRTAAAIHVFEGVLAKGYESAALYNNLGTAYLQEDKIGQAILNYEKALLIPPTNAQIQKNAADARKKAKTIQQPEDVTSKLLKSVLFAFTVDELAIMGLITLAFGLYLMTLHIYRGRGNYKIISSVFLCAAVLTLTVATLQLYLRNNTGKAVVIQQKVIVKKAASSQSKDAFILHEGSVVNVQDNFEGWCKISWAEDEKGWVLSKDIKKIKTLDVL